MAETQIPVQPAATVGAAAPAPLQLKMVLLPDGTIAQAMCIVDDQGRFYLPITEATGQTLIRLLAQLLRVTAENAGALVPDDLTALGG